MRWGDGAADTKGWSSAVSRADEGRTCLGPGMATAVDVRWGGHAGCFHVQSWEERKLEPTDTLKRGEAHGGNGHGLVGIFFPQELLRPTQGILGDQAVDGPLHFLVNVLCLTTELGLENGGHADDPK